jgi:signal peptidase I
MRGFLTETLETVLLALVIFLILQASIQNFRVEGASMKPALDGGEYLLVSKLSHLRIPIGEGAVLYPFAPPDRGNVVVFRFPGDPTRFFVKRVIGVPGDTVELREGRVYLNGDRLEEPYLERRDSSNRKPVLVPADSYFVMGDNRPFSNDSRDWSFIFVPRAYIIGEAWLTYGPFPQLDRLYPSHRIS